MPKANRQGIGAGSLTAEHLQGNKEQRDLPKGLEKALRNGGNLPWSRFGALHGTVAEDGTPACIRLDGRVQAIAEKKNDQMKVRTWLGE